MKQKATKILILLLLLMPLSFHNGKAASNEDVVNTAKSSIGVPYLWGGTTPAGFDCSGFIRYVYNKLGIDLPRISADQYNTGTKISKPDLQPGDLVFFEKTYEKAGITHSGIYIGNDEFISATSSKGVKIDSLSSTYWGPKYYGASRVLTNPTDGFSDVSTENLTYHPIMNLTEQEIILGYSDGTFRPNDHVTRAQAAVIINRVLKKQPTNLSTFTDVPTSKWYAADVAAMKEFGIINGFTDGTFRPDDNMTRAQMAVILQNAFDLQAVNMAQSGNRYVDIPSTYWAHDAIVTMSSIDTTSVFAGNRYHATDLASRAFFTTGIYNSINAASR